VTGDEFSSVYDVPVVDVPTSVVPADGRLKPAYIAKVLSLVLKLTEKLPGLKVFRPYFKFLSLAQDAMWEAVKDGDDFSRELLAVDSVLGEVWRQANDLSDFTRLTLDEDPKKTLNLGVVVLSLMHPTVAQQVQSVVSSYQKHLGALLASLDDAVAVVDETCNQAAKVYDALERRAEMLASENVINQASREAILMAIRQDDVMNIERCRDVKGKLKRRMDEVRLRVNQ
jgi:hypothetical protein